MVLGEIANPAVADIAGALDVRQKRLDEQERRRREIRTKQLVSEALPGLRDGSPLKELAKNDIQTFAFMAKTLGVPLNSGEMLQSFADDIHSISRIAQADPQGAVQFADSLRKQKQEQGLDTKKLDEWLGIAQQDIGKAIRAVDVMDRSLNADIYRKQEMESRELGLKERALDIQEKRIAADQNQMAQGTSDQKNWEKYQRLLRVDPQAAEQFGRASGFVSKEGQQLSAFAEKQLSEASDEYNKSLSATNRYRSLAENLRNANASGGLASTWSEYIKEQTGNQDEITALRKEALGIANSEAINNLPPGPATDRDIELARAPFPTEKASPEYVANWLDAVARLNEKRAEYAEFKADFIAKNGSLRDRNNRSLAEAWRESQKSSQQEQPASASAPDEDAELEALRKKYGL